jgi:energy-coupling factor transport system permease protein
VKTENNIHGGNNANPAFLQRLDPRSKMIFTTLIILSTLLLESSQIVMHIFVLTLLFTMTFFSGHPMLYFIHKLSKIYIMIFLITFLLPFQSSISKQDILFEIGSVTMYKSGIKYFLMINFKYIIIILSTIILTGTTSLSQLIKGLESFNLPVWFLAILTFMFRLIYLLRDEISKMHTAFQSRYITLPYLLKIKIMAKMTSVYFVRIVGRSERTFDAMISRGFTGQCPTTLKLHWQYKDSLLTSAGLVFTIVILIIR